MRIGVLRVGRGVARKSERDPCLRLAGLAAGGFVAALVIVDYHHSFEAGHFASA
jgi:hypothetical protein